MANSPMMLLAQNQRDVALSGAKELAYLGLAHGAAKASDFADFVAGQEFSETGDETGGDCVTLISSIGNPFKIGRRAVGLNAVNVVDVWEPTRVGHESQGDEAVDIKGLPLTVYPQSDLRVSGAVRAWPQDFTVASLGPIQAITGAVQASNAANVADFIESREAFVSDGSPLLSNCGIHSAGRLSDIGGLAVKNPSRALTLGGFAHTKARRVNTQVTEA